MRRWSKVCATTWAAKVLGRYELHHMRCADRRADRAAPHWALLIILHHAVARAVASVSNCSTKQNKDPEQHTGQAAGPLMSFRTMQKLRSMKHPNFVRFFCSLYLLGTRAERPGIAAPQRNTHKRMWQQHRRLCLTRQNIRGGSHDHHLGI